MTAMTVKDLQSLYDYGYWADRELFEILRQLTAEEFTQSVAGSYGSVRNTMVHTMSAEWGWLDRCGAASRGAALAASEYPTVDSLIDRWRQVSTARWSSRLAAARGTKCDWGN
jgi:uncharacterized damage-inducible protein DinB